MPDLAGWTEAHVDLVTKWRYLGTTTTGITRGSWAIHVEDRTGERLRRLTHAPSGCDVVSLPERSVTDEDMAVLAGRLDKLYGIDWSRRDGRYFQAHRKRVKAVIRRWQRKLEAKRDA
jgi:hypothetical protein